MNRKLSLDSNSIKLIAIIAMTIDHITWAVFPGFPHEVLPVLLHIIGRLTCPVMCWFIAEGYHYTKNVDKYTARLFLFAFISHFAYRFSSTDFTSWRSFIPFYDGVLNQTSVMWPLALGLVMLRINDSEKLKKPAKILLIILCCVLGFPSDWSCIASLVILAFGTNRGNLRTQMIWMMVFVGIYSAVYFFALDKVYGLLQMAVIISAPVLMLYNGKRGRNERINRIMKWFFYLYYPAHLFLIGLFNMMK